MHSGPVRYLSAPADVSMDDQWYEIAHLDHPWIVRRFEVLRCLADSIVRQAAAIAEVGCGRGLLQRQVEDSYGVPVTGFELSEAALKQTASRSSPVCCYDIFDQNPEYAGKFNLILLFDVLEHIRDEDRFLGALLFHLAPNGRILINVPANQGLFSAYDRVVGHVRRYNISSLAKAAERSGMRIEQYSYWGLPLVPLLMARKLWLAWGSDDRVVSAGFDTGGALRDRLLLWLSRCERIPQRISGTSLMAVLRRMD